MEQNTSMTKEELLVKVKDCLDYYSVQPEKDSPLKEIKTTKCSLSDLENVPSNVKYVTVLRQYRKNGELDVFISIRTENRRFFDIQFDMDEQPEVLANNAIESFIKGKLRSSTSQEVLLYFDTTVEKGVLELKCSTGKHTDFYYYV